METILHFFRDFLWTFLRLAVSLNKILQIENVSFSNLNTSLNEQLSIFQMFKCILIN